MKSKTILTLILLLIAGTIHGADVVLSVDPGRGKRSIEVGDMFYITIEVVNVEGSPERPANVPGAKLAYFDRTGSSSQFMTTSGGKTVRNFSNTWTLTLRAQKEGSFSYGPISVNGVKSNTVKYNIGKAMPRQDNTQPSSGNTTITADDTDDGKPKFIGHGDQNLFLRANVNKTTAWEQEALVYTVKLYTTYDAVKFIGATSAPKFDGFVVEESKEISNQLSYETYNGKTYATAVIARYIIFPQMTDALKVRGNTYTISVDRREYYHDPFFGNLAYSQPLQLNVTPNDLTVNVKPLPLPKPADFCGGVGKFSLSSSLKGTEFKTNQTSSVVYTITGSGNIKYVQMPELGSLYPPQLEIYTPSTTQKISTGSATVSGSVSFDYSFMPLEEGSFSIPAIKMSYFNPESGQYETAEAKGYSISVGKGAGSAKSQARKKVQFNQKLQQVEISRLRKSHRPVIYGFPYWLFYIIPCSLLVLTWGMRYRYERLHSDMAAFNSRRADKVARRRLRRAESAMKKNHREAFYDELLKALWGYLGDKLKMPTSELMRDNIRQMLESQNINAKAIDRMIALIDEAEFAKYSSAGGSSVMEKDYKEAVASINGIEESFRESKK